MYWKIELRACSWVANVRRRSRSFSSEAKNDSLAALSCGLPLRLLDCVIRWARHAAPNVTAVYWPGSTGRRNTGVILRDRSLGPRHGWSSLVRGVACEWRARAREL